MKENVLPPLYIQIKNFLIGKIESGEYEENGKLPSERELSEKFNVSRMTARNALNEVVNEGYAMRDGVRGTFAVGRKVKKNLFKLDSFANRLREEGITDTKKVIEEKVLEADRWISKKLNIAIGSKCFEIVRLRMGNDIPIAIEYSYLGADKFPGLLRYDFSHDSLFQIMEDKYGCRVVRTKSKLEMGYFNKRNAKLLKLKEGDAGFMMKEFNYDAHDEVAEYCISVYRGDLWSFVYEIQR